MTTTTLPSSPIILLFGGTSAERLVSVASAQHLTEVLPEAQLWYWQKDGEVFQPTRQTLLAHQRPFERELDPLCAPSFESLERALDAAPRDALFFLALHGGSGEDGTVQRWLEDRRLVFTGSSAEASARAFDKRRAKSLVEAAGGKTAESVIVKGAARPETEKSLRDMLARHGRLVQKPVADGSSVGLFFVNEGNADEALSRLFAAPTVEHLLEPFLEGRELTVGILDSDAGSRPLPCSEVRVDRGRSFDYAGKYLGQGTQEITPAELSSEAAAQAQALALLAHRACGLSGYSRTDMIVTAQGPVFLEINNLPGLTKASFIPQQLACAGLPIRDFVVGQLRLAKSRARASTGEATKDKPSSSQGDRA